jgi:two-component system chemotaxis response regulator CheB
MSGRRTRVLVADDSLTTRRLLVDALAADADLQVVGEAADGRAAARLCAELAPDVVTMDVVMPLLTGVAATAEIMARCPTPILVVSATQHGEALSSFDALAAGAVDVLEKPGGTESVEAWADRLRASVKRAARIPVISRPRARRPPASGAGASEGDDRPEVARRLVAIGASTGGPAAVATILRALPRAFPLPVLLVIHIGPLFASTLAEWLDGVSALRVRTAVDGEPLPAVGAARVLVAPPDRHLLVERGLVRLGRGPERQACRPSVDELFESVAREVATAAVGCLLTGMGVDGAEGLLAMRRAGAHTIAQDEATSTVFGMPGAAARTGAAARVLPVDRIAPALVEAARAPRAHGRSA